MIDRQALLARHSPLYTEPIFSAPLSVGNGRFCFTADITGLQSLTSEYDRCPLCTMAEWGWHRYSGAPVHDKALRLEPYDTFGRPVHYATRHEGQEDLFYALRQNAHKVNLARIGLLLDGHPLQSRDLDSTEQYLNLWEAVLYSTFQLTGQPVRVITFVHPKHDALCVRVESPLLSKGRLAALITFPYGSHRIEGGDFTTPDKHTTTILHTSPGRASLERIMDNLSYRADIIAPGAATTLDEAHTLSLHTDAHALEFILSFTHINAPPARYSSFSACLAICKKEWQGYWEAGGAVELIGSKDPRAMELERRMVLSQYLVAIQSRGYLPPAETGLTINSWYGKFNVEMHCWHQAHFALWGRHREIEKSLPWYQTILPAAMDIARSQGYSGARWPKLCDESGYNSPSSIAVLLVWQQPHPILLAELCRRNNPSPDFLKEYREVIVQAAEFMASFAHWDGTRYILGPPYIPAQERFDPRTVLNAGYEVEYFRWGLRTVTRWLELMGEKPNLLYAEIADKLACPAVSGGLYPAHENCPETFQSPRFRTDHPSMTAMLGVLPGERVDRAVMNATLDAIIKDWDLSSAWGWDFPMLAMTAARLGRTGDAVELLLMDSPKNFYLPNGHNRQGDKKDLPLYLPGNSGLLLATGMMAAGWEGALMSYAPGFPKDGSFAAIAEGMHPYI